MSRKLFYLTCICLLLGLTLTSAVKAELVGWWRLDEGTGTTAYDSSGNGNDGTLQGDPQWVAGKVGGALEFDGDGDYVNCGNDPIFDITEEITLAIWVNANDIGNGAHNCWLGKGDNTYAIKHQSGNNLEFFIYDGSWHSTNYTTNINSLNGEWHHMAGTYDGSELKFYLDGEMVLNSAYSSTIGTANHNVTIGENSQQTGRYFDGMLDDARIYNEALSQVDIQSIMLGGAYPYASGPDPEDGAVYSANWVNLSWRAGDYAVSHDIYMGDNFDDVNNATPDSELFRGNQDLLLDFYLAGFPPYAYPDGLVNGTTYYWRIDEVNDANAASPWKGPVWSFWIPPKNAYNAAPADGTMFVPTDVTLTWKAGYGAKLHYIAFGDDFDEVSNATGVPNGTTSYNPGPLEMNKTYYWRVDETDGFETYKGDVMSFTTTMEGLGEVVMERWENITGTDVPSLTNSPKYPNNPDVTERLSSFSWDLDVDNYGGRIHGWLYAPGTGDYTFWLCTDDNGELWLSTDDDSTNIRLIALESNYSNPNTWGVDEEQSDPIPLVAGQKYYIMALWKEGTGGDHCQVAWQGPGVPERVIILGSNLSPYEPLNAYGAKPPNNATGVTQTPVIQWKAGLQAASHELYFGMDEEAVRNATKASPEYKGSYALGDESFDPGKLAWETKYYWRVDEVNATNPDSPWVGNVWNFTTADFLIIDDFEDYDAGENQIWYAWHDGLGYGAIGTPDFYPGNGTGAAVGDETTPSYTEETIVHSGGKSMPISYDNNKQSYSKYSEVEKTLSTARDWTEEGVVNLSLWFRGYPASTGSFVEAPVGTYTMTGSGADIWNQSDEFHYAYMTLTGAGSIIARVQSIDDTHTSAKAAVMIRETLDPNSSYAITAVTSGAGVIAEYRAERGGDAQQASSETGITAPYWVKLERSISGYFTWSSSSNGSTWQVVGESVPEPIQMATNVYIGLAVTSHDAAETCQAVFTNVTTTGNVTGQWANQDIGIESNDPEPLYVAVSNNTGAPAVIVHEDPAAAQIDTWTQWIIPLQDLADLGITLTNVDRIAIGLGTQGNTTVPGGKGKMYIDDIRLLQPAPEPAE